MKKAFKVITLLMLVILVVTAFTMPASAKEVFTDLNNYMKDGVLIRQVVNVLNEIDLTDKK